MRHVLPKTPKLDLKPVSMPEGLGINERKNQQRIALYFLGSSAYVVGSRVRGQGVIFTGDAIIHLWGHVSVWGHLSSSRQGTPTVSATMSFFFFLHFNLLPFARRLMFMGF